MPTFHLLRLKKIIKQTPKAVSLVFDIPENLIKSYHFLPGQYVSLEKNINEKPIRRAYSISSTPLELQKKILQVTIKAIKNGLFSNYALQNLKKGDTLKVSIPEGNFNSGFIEENEHILCVAAGSGITPIFSILKNGLQNSDNIFTLIYGNKNSENTIFKNEIDTLAKKYPKKFSLFYAMSQQKNKKFLKGRIDENILEAVKKKVKQNFDRFFLCGPQDLVEKCKTYFAKKNGQEHAIHTELFFVKSENLEEKKSENISKKDTTKATIVLDDEQITLEMKNQKSILTNLLEQGLDPPYSCQGGVCSSCMAKITEGKAVMSKNNILTEEEVAEGFILTCMAHPTTENISVNFDEV